MHRLRVWRSYQAESRAPRASLNAAAMLKRRIVRDRVRPASIIETGEWRDG